jgi:hypothetical protein
MPIGPGCSASIGVSGQFLLRVVKDEVITDYESFQAWVNCVANSRPLCQIDRNNDDISEILDDIVMSCFMTFFLKAIPFTFFRYVK